MFLLVWLFGFRRFETEDQYPFGFVLLSGT